jgi:5-methylcytosine-specific restriction endonuclease McrA
MCREIISVISKYAPYYLHYSSKPGRHLTLAHQPVNHIKNCAALMRHRIQIAGVVKVGSGKQLVNRARAARVGQPARGSLRGQVCRSSVAPQPAYQGWPKTETGLPANNASKPMVEVTT